MPKALPLIPFLNDMERELRKIMPADGQLASTPRFVWIGSSRAHWATLGIREDDLDEAIARVCGVPGQPTFPWAHGPCWVEELAMLALRSEPRLEPSPIGVFAAAVPENTFPRSRAATFCRFVQLPEAQVALALEAFARAFPAHWVHASSGAKLPPATLEAPSAGSAPLQTWPPHFASSGDNANPNPPYAQLQVDGDGHVHWLWLPAAARALGAPAWLSVSGHGARLVGWGDVYGAANRIALDDPARFRSQFAEAIAPASPVDIATRAHLPPQGVRLIFEVFDRLCVERAALAAASPDCAPSAPRAPRI